MCKLVVWRIWGLGFLTDVVGLVEWFGCCGFGFRLLLWILVFDCLRFSWVLDFLWGWYNIDFCCLRGFVLAFVGLLRLGC